MKLEQMKIIFGATLIVAIGSFALKGSAQEAPTIENCMQRTGQAEEKCAEMVNKFKNMTSEERTKMQRGPGEKKEQFRAGNKEKSPMKKLSDEKNIDARIEHAKRMKAEKEQRLSNTEKRIEKIIEYLKSKDIETTAIENNLAAFKDKEAQILSTIDSYISALEKIKSEGTDDFSSAETVRAQIGTLTADLSSFYRSTLRESIKTAIESLK